MNRDDIHDLVQDEAHPDNDLLWDITDWALLGVLFVVLYLLDLGVI